MSDFRGRCSSCFSSHRARACPKTVFHCHVASMTRERYFTFPRRWYLFIYLHLHAFELLGWRGAGTKRREFIPFHGSDLTTAGLLTLQHRLLQFSPQRHHVPFAACLGLSNISQKRFSLDCPNDPGTEPKTSAWKAYIVQLIYGPSLLPVMSVSYIYFFI